MTPDEMQWCTECSTHHAPARGRPPAEFPDFSELLPGVVSPLTNGPDGEARAEPPTDAEEIPIPYMAATLNIPVPIDDEIRIILITKNAYGFLKLPSLTIADKAQRIWWSALLRLVLNK